MYQPLVECVPNFSEARRPDVVDAIIQAIKAVPGVHVLDHHSDLDHNRTVITYIGSPVAVEEAAFQGIAKAAQLIDLNFHSGEHPRIGAADVVPFIPINQVTMPECVEMARRLGKRVGQDLNIPVYLYENAATRPERQNLENIRQGQFEGLKAEIAVNPERFPDFGPRELGPAGATVIGARQPLIAFNVYLNTNDVSIAQKIAKSIRHSSGGLRNIKAMGVMVESRAQVSMNLTNFRQTPVARVIEMIRSEAAHYGVGILRSELVGLIPRDALVQAAKWYLQLDDLEPTQILENRIFEKVLEPAAEEINPETTDFLERLSSGKPTPGGGSASAFAGAAGAALVAMVARSTIGKKNYLNVEKQMVEIRDRADRLRSELSLAISQDAAVFQQYLNAVRLPKDTPEQESLRKEALQVAMMQTVQEPLGVAEKAVEVMELAVITAQTGNINAIADAVTAGNMAETCFRGANLNIRINARGIDDRNELTSILVRLQILERKVVGFAQILQTSLKERGHLTFNS